MHKKDNPAKSIGREASKTGWKFTPRGPKQNILGEINQPHISMGKGHHLARCLGSRNWQAARGRG